MIEVAPGPAPLDAAVRVPGSKYEANRFLIAAALTDGTTRLSGLPEGEDIRAAISAVDALGGSTAGRGGCLKVRGTAAAASPGSSFDPGGPVRVSVGESGTLLRFLTAAAATVPGSITITGSGRIRERPVAGLVAALGALGADIETTGGFAPLTVRSGRLDGGIASVPATESSQFASGLLLAAPRAAGAVSVELEGDPVSASYLDLTVSVMARCGVHVERPGPRRFQVASGARYQPGDHRISGDWTSAGYFFAAAALAPGRVTVDGLDPESPQGERRFPEVLRGMGCEVSEALSEEGVRVTVTGASRLRGVSVDMRSMPDAVPTLAAIAPFAEGITRIRGTSHLRHKESDRIAALADGLGRLGARATATDGGLAIEPPEGGAAVRAPALDAHGDHRIAMALALTGLRIPGVRVGSPQVVAKSFPDFWRALAELGVRVSGEEAGP
ncbi:MAG: 3-phosphoshikimate 1-carboxyvinyltransferase [Acidobacteriota bacterium]|nr:3-phosphoshikimate 1-carboxyvinyltransferase [Acidobacteriota bacterium]